jgi:elongation factor Ts
MSMEITASLVKELRERSGAGMMECKKALTENAATSTPRRVAAQVGPGQGRQEGQPRRRRRPHRAGPGCRQGACWSRSTPKPTSSPRTPTSSASPTPWPRPRWPPCSADVEALKSAKLPSGENRRGSRAALPSPSSARTCRSVAWRASTAPTTSPPTCTAARSACWSNSRAATCRPGAWHRHARRGDEPAVQQGEPTCRPTSSPRKRKSSWPRCPTRTSAKPAEILEKIIGGKIAKIVNEVTLYGQPYVLDTDTDRRAAALKAAGADVIAFQRLVVGEGIEKVVEDYAAEVAKAMQV